MIIENLTNIHLASTALLFLIVIWQGVRIYRLDRVRKHFYSAGMKKNLEDLMAEHDQAIAKIDREIIDLNDQTENLRTINMKNFQRAGFVRYSQFAEAGNLSFSLVLLDDHQNGFAISSLHARDGARVYAKEIKLGKSKAKLTDEETQALTQALTNSNGQD